MVSLLEGGGGRERGRERGGEGERKRVAVKLEAVRASTRQSRLNRQCQVVCGVPLQVQATSMLRRHALRPFCASVVLEILDEPKQSWIKEASLKSPSAISVSPIPWEPYTKEVSERPLQKLLLCCCFA